MGNKARKKFRQMMKSVAKSMHDLPKDALLPWDIMATGRCAICKRKINIQNIFGPRTRTIKFSCGHGMSLSQVSDQSYDKPNGKFTVRHSMVSDGGKPAVEQKQYGSRVESQNEEVGVVITFVKEVCPEYSEVKKNPEQGSVVDVVASKKDLSDSKSFQVTKLFDREFFRALNSKGEVSIEPDIPALIKGAISRKQNFDAREKKKTILIIDSSPGISVNTISKTQKLDLEALANQSGYSEVWMVGLFQGSILKLK